MTATCLVAWALVLIALPILVVLNLTESRAVKINRARRNGQTWKQIAARWGCSPSTARRWAAA